MSQLLSTAESYACVDAVPTQAHPREENNVNKKILPKANGQNKPATLDLSEDHRTQLLVDSCYCAQK